MRDGRLEGRGSVNDDAVGGCEGFESVDFVKVAVDNGDVAKIMEGGVELCGAEKGGYGNIRVFLTEEFDQCSCVERGKREQGLWVGKGGEMRRDGLPPTWPEAPKKRTDAMEFEWRVLGE